MHFPHASFLLPPGVQHAHHINGGVCTLRHSAHARRNDKPLGVLACVRVRAFAQDAMLEEIISFAGVLHEARTEQEPILMMEPRSAVQSQNVCHYKMQIGNGGSGYV